MNKLSTDKDYKLLIENIDIAYSQAKSNIVKAVNVEMLKAYWGIGQYLVEFEQKGNLKAEYGKELLLQLPI